MARSLEEGRLELHDKLLELVGHAYYSPPESIKMVYPAAVYDMTRFRVVPADDAPYRKFPAYIITIIDREDDVDWVSMMIDNFKYCSLERGFIADNLKHWSFIVYYL